LTKPIEHGRHIGLCLLERRYTAIAVHSLRACVVGRERLDQVPVVAMKQGADIGGASGDVLTANLWVDAQPTRAIPRTP
jgi:hypothetical protein